MLLYNMSQILRLVRGRPTDRCGTVLGTDIFGPLRACTGPTLTDRRKSPQFPYQGTVRVYVGDGSYPTPTRISMPSTHRPCPYLQHISHRFDGRHQSNQYLQSQSNHAASCFVIEHFPILGIGFQSTSFDAYKVLEATVNVKLVGQIIYAAIVILPTDIEPTHSLLFVSIIIIIKQSSSRKISSSIRSCNFFDIIVFYPTAC